MKNEKTIGTYTKNEEYKKVSRLAFICFFMFLNEKWNDKNINNKKQQANKYLWPHMGVLGRGLHGPHSSLCLSTCIGERQMHAPSANLDVGSGKPHAGGSCPKNNEPSSFRTSATPHFDNRTYTWDSDEFCPVCSQGSHRPGTRLTGLHSPLLIMYACPPLQLKTDRPAQLSTGSSWSTCQSRLGLPASIVVCYIEAWGIYTSQWDRLTSGRTDWRILVAPDLGPHRRWRYSAEGRRGKATKKQQNNTTKGTTIIKWKQQEHQKMAASPIVEDLTKGNT